MRKTLTAQVGQIKNAKILEDLNLLIGCNTEAEVVKVKKPVGVCVKTTVRVVEREIMEIKEPL